MRPLNVRLLRFVLASVVLLGGWSAGCSKAETSSPPSAEAPESSRAKNAPTSDQGPSSPLVLAHGVRFVKAGPENDVPKLVRSEREKAAADSRDLVVYIGAKWCEPCQRFHEAAKRGDLDGDFPQLTILEFDLDEDRERLTAAGYMSKLIPLFVMPAGDGRASDRRFEGGVKGDGAVANITPRLRKLLTK